MAKKRRPKMQPDARRPKGLTDGLRSNTSQGKRLVTHSIGALPILNQLLERMRLQEFLAKHLPPEDKRTKVDAPRVVLLVLKNLLVSREPMYGITEWARNYGPELFDLWPEQVDALNDDRIGRVLERMFMALDTNVIMDVVAHVVKEFDVQLDELHNDSTTVTFFGDYPEAQEEQTHVGRTTPAITWGHNKDHRPDLKQLLYVLTVSDDGGVPVYFQAQSGNVTDDQTHQATWKLLRELVKRPDFVYVADCKLATTDNMNEIARQGGRFITVLPATRKENTQFRQRLCESSQSTKWRELYRLVDDDGTARDVFQVCSQEELSKEGYRLLWFHSRGKQESDAATRVRRIQRASKKLSALRERLLGPRTRLRQLDQVRAAVDTILDEYQVRDFLEVDIQSSHQEKFRQATPGRPSKKTRYKREVETRYSIHWEVNTKQLEQATAGDGVFPLITNLSDWEPAAVLQAYKRQPIIEKRFSQLKTDFRVAPVYLKSVKRIVGLLAIYFFALMVQSLLERELRNAMRGQAIDTLPLYPEGRACSRPTTRQVLDVFEPLARHTLFFGNNDDFDVFHTELAPIHHMVLKLLRMPANEYHE